MLVDSVDIHFLRMARGVFCGSSEGGVPQMKPERGVEIIRELNTYAAADAVLTVSEKERGLLKDLLGSGAPIFTVPDCEDLRPATLDPAARRGILFLGNFKHPPNAGAAEFLLRDIVPLLDRELLEQHPLYVVGNALDGRFREFAESNQSIRLVGWVPEVEPYLTAVRIAVSPLLYGAGTKRKLIQSLMIGTPTVCTEISVEGLGLRHGSEVLVANDPKSFAASITQLLTDDDLWQRLARAGISFIKQAHTREAAKNKLREAVEAVLSAPGRPAPTESTGRHAYQELIHRTRAGVRRAVPPGAAIAVVSKGDPQLLLFDQIRGVPFPQDVHGEYAGYHPRNSAEAIEHLAELVQKGTQYLVFPATSFWWFKHYRELATHLEATAKRVWADDDCVIFQLTLHPTSRGKKAGKPSRGRRRHSALKIPR
ncbi:MAG TPA: glycosyltransferase family 4 protein [Pirellulales bacterium]|nr:glycosyltransferase family 4 protein [Pirellulales bacterium]